MLWPKSSIPKFGNWDINDYSIVFDKVRAEKERALHVPDGNFDNNSSIRSLSPHNDGGTGNRTSQRFSLVKVRGQESLLHIFQENRSFAPPHHNAFRHSDQTADKGTNLDTIRTKESMSYRSPPTSSTRQWATLSDQPTAESQQYYSHFQTGSQNLSDVPNYNPLLVSDIPSRQPRQSGATKESQNPDDLWYQQRHLSTYPSGLHSKPPNLSGTARHRFAGEPATKARIPHQSLRGPTAQIQHGRPTVPKFGDWEHGDGFTTAFNNMRKQRSSEHAVTPHVGLAPLQLDKDLYGDSEPSKFQRGWRSIICCSRV